jgi:hypothetical protein
MCGAASDKSALGADHCHTNTSPSVRAAFMGGAMPQKTSCSPGGEPKVSNLRVGTPSQHWELVPRRQIWCRSALPWTTDIKSQERFELGPARRP